MRPCSTVVHASAKRTASLLLAACALATPCVLAAQATPSPGLPPQQPGQNTPLVVPPLLRRPPIATLKANARAVLLDVIVTDSKGHPVHGLKPSDFIVTEDGIAQRVASFNEHQASVISTSTAPASPRPVNTWSNPHPVDDGRAAVVLFLDGLDTPPAAQAFVRQQLNDFAKHLQPGTPVAIFALDTRLRLIQGFTTDPDQVRAAIHDREKILLPVIPNDLGYVAQQFRFDALSTALKGLGQYLQQRPGRKSLIWFTGALPFWAYDDGSGFGGSLADNESLFHDYPFAGDLKDAADALVLGQVTIYPVDARGLLGDPAFSATRGGVPSLSSFSRFDTAQAFQHQDLDQAAAATGGKAFYNTNGLTQIVERVVDTGANFYRLSYSPSNHVWDGKQRHIQVELNTQAAGTRGLQLQYRHSYYAVNDLPQTGQIPAPPRRRRLQPGQVSIQPDALADAMQLGAIDPGQIVFDAHVAPEPDIDKVGKHQPLPPENFLDPRYRGKPFRNLDVDFHVDAGQIQLTPASDGLRSGSVEFVGVIVDDKGKLVNSMHEQTEMNLREGSYQQALAGGMEMPLKIAVPVSGNFFLRVGVRDNTTGKIGVIEVPTGDIRLTAPAP